MLQILALKTSGTKSLLCNPNVMKIIFLTNNYNAKYLKYLDCFNFEVTRCNTTYHLKSCFRVGVGANFTLPSL